jgi:hypothetical protein
MRLIRTMAVGNSISAAQTMQLAAVTIWWCATTSCSSGQMR